MADVNAILANAAAHPALGPLVRLADVDDNKVTPGLLGFVVFAALGTAVWLLMKSMNKQFKKVDFEVEPDEPAASGAASREAGEPGTR